MTQYRRKTLRIPGYDYATPGSYFVTICANDRLPRFGVVSDSGLAPTAAGEMLEVVWRELPTRFPQVSTDAMIAMPDHLHGILWINADDGLTPTVPLSRIVQAFKSLTTHHYMHGVREFGWTAFSGRLWQQNYYEHIIRSDASLERHREYIAANPHHRWLKQGS